MRWMMGGIFGTTTAATLVATYWVYEHIKGIYYDHPITYGRPPISPDKYIPNRYFDQLQQQLQDKDGNKANRIALVGPQGAGKSVAVAQVFSDTSWFEPTGVFGTVRHYYRKITFSSTVSHPWLKASISIPAETLTRSEADKLLQQQLLRLAQQVNRQTFATIEKNWIYDRVFKKILSKFPDFASKYLVPQYIEENEESTLQSLKAYLESYPDWLLLFDNPEDLNAIKPYLPERGGTLLITTNNKDLANATKHKISFGLLNNEESTTLLRKYLPEHSLTENEVRLLIDTYWDHAQDGILPLGLIQACAYLNNTQQTVAAYLKELKEAPLRLANTDTILLGDHLNLCKTWQLTLKRLRNTHREKQSGLRWLWYTVVTQPNAPTEQLLYLMSLFASAPVPQAYLQSAYHTLAPNDGAFLVYLNHLIQYNLLNSITTNDKQRHLSLHILNQRILQALIQSEALKTPSLFSWAYWAHYLWQNPQYLDAVMQALIGADDTTDLNTQLQHGCAVEALVDAASPKRYQNENDNHLALWMAAKQHEFDELSFADRQAFQSVNPDNTAREALERQIRRLEKALKMASNNLPLKASILNSLANAHGDLGDPNKKRELLERALNINENHFGPNHWQTAITLGNLANAHGALGDPQTQHELLERALRIKEAHYEPNHWQTASTLNNLAIAYGTLGDPHTKRDLLERALKIFENHYGTDHWRIAMTLTNLGDAYRELDETTKARTSLQRALKIKEAHFGEDHWQTAITLTSLATTTVERSEQFQLLERALDINEKHYGPNHWQTVTSLINLANVCEENPNKQRMLLERALQKINENDYGPNDLKTADTQFRLAMTCYQLFGDVRENRLLLQKVYAVFLEKLGENNIKTRTAKAILDKEFIPPRRPNDSLTQAGLFRESDTTQPPNADNDEDRTESESLRR